MSDGISNKILQICDRCGKEHPPNVITAGRIVIFCHATFKIDDAERHLANTVASGWNPFTPMVGAIPDDWPEIIE